MIRVLRTDGELLELPLAVSAEIQGKELVCYDRYGVALARYPSDTVTIFGRDLPDHSALTEADEAGDAAAG